MKTTPGWRPSLVAISSAAALALLLLSCQREIVSPSSTRSSVAPSLAQASVGDWPTYSGDLSGRRYSRLSRISRENVGTLRPKWTYKLGRRPGGDFSQATPLAIAGRVFLPAGNSVASLDGSTGKVIWRRELGGGRVSYRGVAYWPGTEGYRPRILVTMGRQLLALEAQSGELVEDFGSHGSAALEVPYLGAPTVFGNIVLVGSNVPEALSGEPGSVSAYDAIQGTRLWTFHTVPQGEEGAKTWGDGWKARSGANVWAFSLSVDAERGLVYVPVAAPADDYWGADRPGDNLYSNSVVALDARDGHYVWHFQTVHHDLWNYDLCSAPTLLELRGSDGGAMPGLALAGKTGYLYLLDRSTGQPVFEMREQPVPAGNVPGEWYSPTQPVPVKPPPVSRTSFSQSDLVSAGDTTPEHAEAAQAWWKRSGLKDSGPFTPFSLRGTGPPVSTMQMPGAQGGVCWGGLGLDPSTGWLYCNARNLGMVGYLEPNPEYQPGSNAKFVRNGVDGEGAFSAARAAFAGPEGKMTSLPAGKPPWSQLVAVDSQKGEIVWRTPLGAVPGLPEDKQKLGLARNAGPLVTAGGLVFIGAAVDRKVRAFDARTGEEVWAWDLQAPGEANPMTYLGGDGEQYVAIVAADTLYAFTTVAALATPRDGER